MDWRELNDFFKIRMYTSDDCTKRKESLYYGVIEKEQAEGFKPLLIMQHSVFFRFCKRHVSFVSIQGYELAVYNCDFVETRTYPTGSFFYLS